MNIAVFIKRTTFHKGHGGLETQNQVLCEGLALRGNHVTVFSPKWEYSKDTESLNGVTYRFIDSKYKMGMFLGFFGSADKSNWFTKSSKVFLEMNAKKKFDLVISQSSAGVGVIKNKLNHKVLCLVISHGTIMSEYKTYLKELSSIKDLIRLVPNTLYVLKNFFSRQRDLIHGADHVVTVSNYVKEALMEETFGLEDKFTVIPNGIDPKSLNSDVSKKGFVPDAIVTTAVDIASPEVDPFEHFRDHTLVHLIFIGRIVKSKGVFELLKIMEDPIFKDTRLHMFGSGPDLPACRSYAKKKSIEDRVVFYGPVSHSMAMEMFKHADIFVFPTLRYEGFPMTIVEAMFAGLPVVANNMGGVADAIEEDKTGYLIKPGDLEMFKTKLRDIVRNSQLRDQLSKKALKTAQKKYTATQMIDTYLDLINNLKAKKI